MTSRTPHLDVVGHGRHRRHRAGAGRARRRLGRSVRTGVRARTRARLRDLRPPAGRLDRERAGVGLTAAAPQASIGCPPIAPGTIASMQPGRGGAVDALAASSTSATVAAAISATAAETRRRSRRVSVRSGVLTRCQWPSSGMAGHHTRHGDCGDARARTRLAQSPGGRRHRGTTRRTPSADLWTSVQLALLKPRLGSRP